MEEDIKDTFDEERKNTTRIRKIIAVRHAESLANSQGIYQGQSFDTELSFLGEKQAEALAKRLKEIGVAKIITSPLKRAYLTARIVAEEVGCEIEFDQRIIETNHGVWEGKHKDFIAENFPDLHRLWLEKPSEVIFPKGEAFMNTVQRTLEFLENTNFEPNTLIVTHDNILRLMISLIMNSDIDKMWEIPLETASLNFFEVNKVNGKNVFRILRLNDVEHLSNLRNDIRVHAL